VLDCDVVAVDVALEVCDVVPVVVFDAVPELDPVVDCDDVGLEDRVDVTVLVAELVCDVVCVVDGDVEAVVVLLLVSDVVLLLVCVLVPVVDADVVCVELTDVVGVVIWQSTNSPDRWASIILFRMPAVASHAVSSRRNDPRKHVMSCMVPPGPVNFFMALFSGFAVAAHVRASSLSARMTCSPSCLHVTSPCLPGHESRMLQKDKAPQRRPP
jgi:hypothetical protein